MSRLESQIKIDALKCPMNVLHNNGLIQSRPTLINSVD